MLGEMRRRDLIYWFIMIDLTLGIIGLFVWKFYDAKELIDQISFAATLSSILLAIVAMVYSYVQSYESSAQNRMVQSALSSIVDKVDEVSHIRDELALIRQDAKAGNDNLLQSLHRYADQVDDHISTVFSLLREEGLEVPAELERDISLAYRDKFNHEVSAIRSRFESGANGGRAAKPLHSSLISLIRESLKSGYQVTLLELVDLLVYKGMDFQAKELNEALLELERMNIIRQERTERGIIIYIL
ncbi:hypothetical protein ACFO9Q_15570 [Paenibacillus sp. GCM10023252]|uniref:hypothetical protein n=1 Tax=Paenibacillus sp. GCM10023252 TaxID=3252649 RepID=UPI003608C759